MNRFRYTLFVLFNHFYKDGTYRHGSAPYTTTIFMLIIMELCCLFSIDILLEKYCGVRMLQYIHFLSDNGPVTTQVAMIILIALIYPINHWLLISKRGLDKIYQEFHLSDLNSRNNKVLFGRLIVILYLAMFFFVGILKQII